MPHPLTQYERERLASPPSTPAGTPELILNEDHLSRVVQNGMAKAQISLDIMTADFKAMLIPVGGLSRSRKARSIVDLFRSLAQKGVEIRLLHAGTPSGPALHQLKILAKSAANPKPKSKIKSPLPGKITIRRCPRLHAKIVVVDARALYLGSANLTGAGLGAKSPSRRNFEMGLWSSDPALIEPVMEQFNTLWEGHHCPTCGRREICPVPLEEPHL